MDKILPYFSFQGRGNRQRYWLTNLALWGVILVSVLVGTVVPVFGWIVAGVAIIAAIVAGIANSARRLHDRGKSAKWLFAMYLPLYVLSSLGTVLSAAGGDAESAGDLLSLLALPFSIWAFVELGCLKGTSGPNRFGDDLLAPPPVEAVA